jgi:hypothetical protein
MWASHQDSANPSGGGVVHDFPPTPGEPDDYIVMTPAAGIAARSGTTIYSAMCNVYRDKASATAGQRTLEAIVEGGIPWQILVYNLSNAAVLGSRYVVTARTKTGTRYVVVESCSAEA